MKMECQFNAESHELIGVCVACPTDGAWGPLPLRVERGLPLPGRQIILPVLWLVFRVSMLPSFQPLSRNSLYTLRSPYPFDRYGFWNQNRIFLWNFQNFI